MVEYYLISAKDQSRFNSLSHDNLVHKFIPMPLSNENLGCKSSGRYRMGKLTVKSKKEVMLEAQRDKRKVHFATLMNICHLRNAGIRTEISEIQRPGCTPR